MLQIVIDPIEYLMIVPFFYFFLLSKNRFMFLSVHLEVISNTLSPIPTHYLWMNREFVPKGGKDASV